MINKVEMGGTISAVTIYNPTDYTACVRFSICVLNEFTNKNGARYETSEFFNCAYWVEDKKELQLFDKGNYIHFEGRLTCTSYVGSDGESKSYYEIKVKKIY